MQLRAPAEDSGETPSTASPDSAGPVDPADNPRTAAGHAHLTYRPAIDGLRAIAVLAVMVAHLDSRLLPGGWLGVDVFFVISGYLITTLLLRERATTGRLDLPGFWLARARRLLPALFVMLAGVLVAARLIGLPARLGAVSGDALSTILYVANWRMLISDEAYFATLVSPSPLRHAWSLAVEEQFYILFPLLLLVMLRFVRRRVPLAAALAVLAAASAALMALLYTPGLEPSRVYYGTDTRAFELLIGAIAAVLVLRGRNEPAPIAQFTDRAARVVAPIGLLGVLAAFWWASETLDVVFRGGLLLFAIATAAVVVAAASWQPSLLQRGLSWEPLRRIGLISYGLYLWHWPVIVYLNQVMIDASPMVRIWCQVVASFALATASYLLVELPIRRRGMRALIPRLPRLSLAVGVVSAVAVMVGAWALPMGTRPADGGGAVESNLVHDAPPYVVDDQRRSALLIGNSIPASFAENYPRWSFPDLAVTESTNPGCDIFDEPRVQLGRVEPDTRDCQEWRATWSDTIEEQDPDLVVLFVPQSLVADREVEGERLEFDSPGYDQFVSSGLDEILERVEATGNDRRFALVSLACHRLPQFSDDDELRRVSDDVSVQRVNSVVQAWADRRDVPVIDQYDFLCGEGYHDGINDVPLYEDYLHLSEDSGPQVWNWLAPIVRDLAAGRRP